MFGIFLANFAEKVSDEEMAERPSCFAALAATWQIQSWYLAAIAHHGLEFLGLVTYVFLKELRRK